MNRLILFIFFTAGLSFELFATTQTRKVKVACIGASITYGAFIQDREHNSYPAQLQKMLGDRYQVTNYGVNGCTMLKKGDLPYWNTGQYREALSGDPDIVIIDLGGNDSKLVNRKYLNEYESDYHDMIRSFSMLPSHPRIVLLLAMPSFVKDTAGIWDPVIVHQINPRIRQVAFKDGVEVIDMHSAFADKEAIMPDKIHPNAEGAGIMAKKIYDNIVQKKDTVFDVFKSVPKDSVSSFYGYPCANFTFEGRECKVVKPKWSAKGHPWVWRARFWGHEPQADISLLEHGFHIVYCDVAELFGNEASVNLWNDFYSLLHRAGLGKKAVMEGMSRGGVYVFNWAAVNPDKVSCVYVDNPVLDLKSWPAGLGRVAPSAMELEEFKKDYQLTSAAQVAGFTCNPVDKVRQIVKGRYPILILCADADELVPPEENTLLFEQKVKALKRQIKVIHKPGFKHHPHSLPNPAPIVDFILRSAGLYIPVPANREG